MELSENKKYKYLNLVVDRCLLLYSATCIDAIFAILYNKATDEVERNMLSKIQATLSPYKNQLTDLSSLNNIINQKTTIESFMQTYCKSHNVDKVKIHVSSTRWSDLEENIKTVISYLLRNNHLIIEFVDDESVEREKRAHELRVAYDSWKHKLL